MAPQQLSARMTAFGYHFTADYRYREETEAGYAAALEGRTVDSEVHLKKAAVWEVLRDTWQAKLDALKAEAAS